MARPPVLKEFQFTPYKCKSFVKYMLQLQSHSKGTIDAAVGDTVRIRLLARDAKRDRTISPNPFFDSTILRRSWSLPWKATGLHTATWLPPPMLSGCTCFITGILYCVTACPLKILSKLSSTGKKNFTQITTPLVTVKVSACYAPSCARVHSFIQ